MKHGFYIPAGDGFCGLGRIQYIAKKKAEVEASAFTEKDLRGLSECEKVFVRSHDYQRRVGGFVLFIARNISTGRKQLYAQTIEQWFYPNGHDIDFSRFNYECWLTFDRRNDCFCRFNYEVRFSTLPPLQLLFVN